MSFIFCVLCIYALWLKAVSPAESESWNAVLPQSVEGLGGSCVVIPCQFNYVCKSRQASHFTGVWYVGSDEKVYDSSTSEIRGRFQHRTSLLGDLSHRNCSLKINPLRHGDGGPFTFRIEIKDCDKFTFGHTKVSVKINDSPGLPTLLIPEEITVGKKVTATCTVFHSCPTDPPNFIWSHRGTVSSESLQLNNGQWKITSHLAFTPSKTDQQKTLNCTAVFLGGKKVSSMTTLKVKYAPDNVAVIAELSVAEGSAVNMTCSSDSNPLPHTYHWFTEAGTLLSDGRTFTLMNVSRHIGPIYCTAINTVGQTNSSTTQLNVLYAPDNVAVIAELSVAEGSAVNMTCSSDSNPLPHTYHWFTEAGTLLSDGRTFTLTNVSRHIGPIYCTAINTLGQTNSSTTQLNVLYAPEIKAGSSCTLDTTGVTCLFIVDSHPTSDIKFWGADPPSKLHRTHEEKHGTLTIVTLRGEPGSFNIVHCLATNSQGNYTMTLQVPHNHEKHNSSLLYISVVAAAVLVMIIGLSVWIIHCCKKSKAHVTTQPKTEMNVDSQSKPERKCKDLNPSYDGGQHVYGNMAIEGTYEEEYPYDYTAEDEGIYANV